MLRPAGELAGAGVRGPGKAPQAGNAATTSNAKLRRKEQYFIISSTHITFVLNIQNNRYARFRWLIQYPNQTVKGISKKPMIAWREKPWKITKSIIIASITAPTIIQARGFWPSGRGQS